MHYWRSARALEKIADHSVRVRETKLRVVMPRYRWKWCAPALLLPLLGMLGNYVALPLFFGIDLLFGSIATMLAIIWYGPVWGVATAIVASGYTLWLWQHPYAIIIFAFEALFVGWFYRQKKNNILLLNGLFWLLIGIPLVWIFYKGVMGSDTTATLLISVKQAVNGVFNTALALVLALILPLPFRSPVRLIPQAYPLRDWLFLSFIVLIFGPSLVLLYIDSRRELARVETIVAQTLDVSSRNLARSLEGWYKQHLHAVSELSRHASRERVQPSDVLKRRTITLNQAFPSFETMFVSDTAGNIVTMAIEDETNWLTEIPDGFLNAFNETKTTLRPVVSELVPSGPPFFRPTQILNSPILVSNKLAGVAWGLVNRAEISRILADQASASDSVMILLDPYRHILGSSEDIPGPMIPMDNRLINAQSSDRLHVWSPITNNVPSTIRWASSFYVKEIPFTAPIPGSIRIQVPVARYQQQVYASYLVNLGLMIGIAILAFAASRIVSRNVTQPLSELAASTSLSPDGGPPAADSLHVSSSRIGEIDKLTRNFTSMHQRLQESFNTLRARTAELEASEERFRGLNCELNRKVLERTNALQESNEQMETFIYSIAHDLRAPLRAMQGFSDALIEDCQDQLPGEAKEFLNRIIQSASRMDLLISDLLTFSRLSRAEMKFSQIDLNQLVDATLADLADDIRTRDAQIDVEKPLLQVQGHWTTLRQVLTNLICNSLKFVAKPTKPRVRIWSESHGDFVRLHLQDNGIGIAHEHQERIFRVFERLHSAELYPGTGIGLAIVRKGVERMHGHVGLISTPGNGSCFWLDLPKLDTAIESLSDQSPRGNAFPSADHWSPDQRAILTHDTRDRAQAPVSEIG